MHRLTWIVGGAAGAVELWAPVAGAQNVTQNLLGVSPRPQDITQNPPGIRQDNRDIRPGILRRDNRRPTDAVVR